MGRFTNFLIRKYYQYNKKNKLFAPQLNEKIRFSETATYVAKTPFIIDSEIHSLYFNGGQMTISGTAFIKQEVAKNNSCIQHSLVLVNTTNEAEFYEIPLNSIKDNEKNGYVNYFGKVNFNTIKNNQPLHNGTFEFFIKIRQFLYCATNQCQSTTLAEPTKNLPEDSIINSSPTSDTHELSQSNNITTRGWQQIYSTIGKLENQSADYVYSTQISWVRGTNVAKYTLLAAINWLGSNFYIKTKCLSDVNVKDLLTTTQNQPENILTKFLKIFIFRSSYKFFTLFPIRKNKVSFISDSRIDISGSMEYIYNEMLKYPEHFDSEFYFKENIKTPKTLRELFTLAKAIATSRYIILDDFFPLVYPLSIREGIDLIQIWHAVGAFKTFGYSRVGMSGGPLPYSKHHRNYTKVIVSSKNVACKYAEAFGVPIETIHPIGTPRTDLFFDKEKQEHIINSLHAMLPQIKGKKVILFAPTFRGNGQASAHYPFDLIDFKKIYDQFHNQDYVFLLKVHPFIQNQANISYEYQDFYYDVSQHREINELLLVSDILITDYSSVCFEYALLYRPMIFFSPDLEHYMLSRNFYYDYMDFIPGTYAGDTNQLVKQINEAKIDTNRIERFINYFYDDLDGQSSKRFVDHLLNNCYQSTNQEENQIEYTEYGTQIPKWGKQAQIQLTKLEVNSSAKQAEYL